MECNEIIVDMRELSAEDREKGRKMTELLFKLNHTMPMSAEYNAVLKELFGDNIGTGTGWNRRVHTIVPYPNSLSMSFYLDQSNLPHKLTCFDPYTSTSVNPVP